MVLPLPVVADSGDDAVRFIDLAEHAKMFDELHALFYVPPPLSRAAPKSASFRALQLEVHKVGAFVASYVPTRADFSRLDLPDRAHPRRRVSRDREVRSRAVLPARERRRRRSGGTAAGTHVLRGARRSRDADDPAHAACELAEPGHLDLAHYVATLHLTMSIFVSARRSPAAWKPSACFL